MNWNTKDRLVLIGDSITENGRLEDAEGIGQGYVRLIHDYLLTRHPSLALNIHNKGIGGDRITDLDNRWEEDVLKQQPDWLSISIGINDVWRQLDRPWIDQVYPDTFLEVYEKLLIRTKEHTKARLILMEPTLIHEDASSEGNILLQPYVEAVQRLAEKYETVLIPTHQAFQNYLKADTKTPLTTDGVHMNTKGDMLMASTWLEHAYQ
ncbi:SGNH/GDSL hydrolase family protein [Salibacterium halotolerans]|uniref:Lysophospholipase L1 n=1 Tax=Salibacterium halotolerans TaxID=1884432 RepID=A0A1I5X0A3_9BACI|nr:SGNH/GDSL hydrolase family protein [Salibacterium halotolerans]SFQ25423.1 Lysophospholipase L1 [Salibacterium halotolerans]